MTSPRRSLKTPRWRGKELKCVEYLPGAKLFTNGCSRTARDNTQELLFAPFSKGRARLRGRSNLLKPHAKLFLLLQSMTSTKQGQVLPPSSKMLNPMVLCEGFFLLPANDLQPCCLRRPPDPAQPHLAPAHPCTQDRPAHAPPWWGWQRKEEEGRGGKWRGREEKEKGQE